MSFYPGAGRHDALEAVIKAATLGRSIAVIAPKGGGVTTVLGQAAVRLVDYGTVIRMDGAEMESLDSFLSALAVYFDAPESDLQQAVAEAVVYAPIILMADNAHVISADVLLYVAELKSVFETAFAVVFGGRPRLLENLSMPAWEAIQYLELAPLSPSQGVAFIEAALPIELGSVEVAALVQREFSWPAELLSQYALVDQGTTKKPKKIPWWHIVAAFVLLLLLLFVWALKKETSEKITTRIALPVSSTEPISASAGKDTEPVIDKQSSAEARQVERSAVDEAAPKTEPWLRQQAADTFMMQLMLANTEAQAKEIVAKLNEFPASYYRARRNNKDVYIVLLGPFADAKRGRAAVDSLPAALRDKGAFPRSTKQVQQELRR